MITLSIVIATYNSETLLKKVLESLMRQTLDRDMYEILVVDGGSTDQTIKIAKKSNCRVINNPKTEPVHAKYLGYLNSHGKFLMYLDHDEVLKSSRSLEKKLEAFGDKRVKAVIASGYITPSDYGVLNDYINEFGDPFSMFYYRISKEYKRFERQLDKILIKVRSNKNFNIYKLQEFNQIPLMELLAGGSVFDKKYVDTIINKKEVKLHLTHLLLYISKEVPYVALTKNDPIIHYSADKYNKYLKKISWRVKNNIYFVDSLGRTGFSGRAELQSRMMRKYLYIPYVMFFAPLLLDTLYLILSRKKLGYWIHFPLSVYTATLIVYHYILKSLGNKPYLKNYDDTKIVK